MSDGPLRGGQGRTPQDLEDSAIGILMALGLCALCWLIAWLITT